MELKFLGATGLKAEDRKPAWTIRRGRREGLDRKSRSSRARLQLRPHLFIFGATRQRVLGKIDFGAVFVVDLCVQVVLLAQAGRAAARASFLVVVTVRVQLWLFPVQTPTRSTELHSDSTVESLSCYGGGADLAMLR